MLCENGAGVKLYFLYFCSVESFVARKTIKGSLRFDLREESRVSSVGIQPQLAGIFSDCIQHSSGAVIRSANDTAI